MGYLELGSNTYYKYYLYLYYSVLKREVLSTYITHTYTHTHTDDIEYCSSKSKIFISLLHVLLLNVYT